MKFWIDDVRPAPQGYVWIKSVDYMIYIIKFSKMTYHPPEEEREEIELLDLDYDAGDFFDDGGDYIEILKWMEENHINGISIHIHSMNPVGVENMRRIIRHNGWKEV